MAGGTVCSAEVGTAGREAGADGATTEDGAVVGCAGCGDAVEDVVVTGEGAATAVAGLCAGACVGVPLPDTSKGSRLPGPMIIIPVSFLSTMKAKTAATANTASTKVPS